ncbi:MAG: exo-alpha-sialidase [Acidobacteria bacterium]|nr:exo-alpha-sialidase [Acidobacteriota bacterium]
MLTALVGLALALKIVPPTTDIVFKQPQIASTGDRIGLAFGAGNDIYYSFSNNDGETFSRPRKVETKGKMALGRHRGPRIAYQSGNVVISAIVGQKGGGADGDLLVWTSNDNGGAWKPPVRVNDLAGSAREGLHAMASGNGVVFAAWLDLRAKGTQLYGAVSNDGGSTWGKNFLIYESPDGSICQCCHPNVLVAPTGRLYVMWRNSLGGNRDMYMTTSDDVGVTWKPARQIGSESWKLNACPMDGGSLTLSGLSGEAYAAFRKEKEIHYSTVSGIDRALGDGKDPAMIAGMNDALYVVWTGTTGAIEAITSKENKLKVLALKGGYPQIVFTGHRVLAFFEEEGGIGMGVVEGSTPLGEVTVGPKR